MRSTPASLSTSTALAALLVAGITPLVLTAPASAATARYHDDFNGDGHADLSVGADGENGGDGAVWHLRGAATGMTTKNALTFGPSSVGVTTSGHPRLGSLLLP